MKHVTGVARKYLRSADGTFSTDCHSRHWIRCALRRKDPQTEWHREVEMASTGSLNRLELRMAKLEIVSEIRT